MKKSKKPTTKRSANKKAAQHKRQGYLTISMLFFVAGIALTVPEHSRATGIPFLVLALVFFLIAQDSDAR